MRPDSQSIEGRLASRQVFRTVIALVLPLLLQVQVSTLHAQETAQPQSAAVADSSYVNAATLTGLGETMNEPIGRVFVQPFMRPLTLDMPMIEPAAGSLHTMRHLAGGVLSIATDVSSMNEIALDDQMLSRQRGGAVGMVMVAATPQLMRGNGSGNGVTLWDEIAPPAPLPVPVDAARAAQGNVANYQRK